MHLAKWLNEKFTMCDKAQRKVSWTKIPWLSQVTCKKCLAKMEQETPLLNIVDWCQQEFGELTPKQKELLLLMYSERQRRPNV
jgi:hypothetical protein